jgi:hypothetical protein
VVVGVEGVGACVADAWRMGERARRGGSGIKSFGAMPPVTAVPVHAFNTGQGGAGQGGARTDAVLGLEELVHVPNLGHLRRPERANPHTFIGREWMGDLLSNWFLG